MKKYNLIMSVDAVNIDAQQEILSDQEPDFWTCQEIAARNGCDWWTLEEVTQ